MIARLPIGGGDRRTRSSASWSSPRWHSAAVTRRVRLRRATDQRRSSRSSSALTVLGSHDRPILLERRGRVCSVTVRADGRRGATPTPRSRQFVVAQFGIGRDPRSARWLRWQSSSGFRSPRSCSPPPCSRSTVTLAVAGRWATAGEISEVRAKRTSLSSPRRSPTGRDGEWSRARTATDEPTCSTSETRSSDRSKTSIASEPAGDLDGAAYDDLHATYVGRTAEVHRALDEVVAPAIDADGHRDGGPRSAFRRVPRPSRGPVAHSPSGRPICVLGAIALVALLLRGVRLPGQGETGGVVIPKASQVHRGSRAGQP